MKKQKKKLSERIVDNVEEEQFEDSQTAEDDFDFKNDEVELLSALRQRKKTED